MPFVAYVLASFYALLSSAGGTTPEVPPAADAVVERGTVVGIVIDGESGHPVPHARIGIAGGEGLLILGPDGRLTVPGGGLLRAEDGKPLGRTAIATRTDRNGRFRLEDLAYPEEQHVLIALGRSQYAALYTDVVPARLGSETLRVELRPSAALRVKLPRTLAPPEWRPGGTLRLGLGTAESVGADSAAPGAGGSIWFEQVDDDRWFEYPLVPAGQTYQFVGRGTPPEYSYAPLLYAELLTPQPGEKIERLFRDGVTGTKLSGRVLGTDGMGMAQVNVTVTVGGEQGTTTYGTLTDREGRYTFAGLPAGRHRVELRRHRARTAPG